MMVKNIFDVMKHFQQFAWGWNKVTKGFLYEKCLSKP